MEAAQDLEEKIRKYPTRDNLLPWIPVIGDVAYYRTVKEHEMNGPEEKRGRRIGREMLLFCGGKYGIYGMLLYWLADRLL